MESASKDPFVVDQDRSMTTSAAAPGKSPDLVPAARSHRMLWPGGLIVVAVLLLAVVTPPAFAAPRPVSQVVDDVGRRVVKIFGSGGLRGLYAYSTGFLVTPDGYLVTVWSHVLDEETVTVILHDGRKLSGKVVGAEPQLDLAVVKVEADELPCFHLDDAATATPGTRVLAFSNMFKVATGDEPVSVIHGVVSAVTHLTARRGAFETPYRGPVYVVDAITNNPGAGGGVLTTSDGRLLAMIGKELRNSETNTWINYAMPISELKTVVNEIITGRFTTKPAPSDEQPAGPRGYRFSPIDFGLVMVPDVLVRTPAYVDRVIPDSPAARAGIQPNDLILFVDDELVHSCRSLNEALGRQESGDLVKLVLRRGNSLIPVSLPATQPAEPPVDPPGPPATSPSNPSDSD
jgi:serine protease Do